MTILTQQLVLVRQKVVQCVSIERKVYRIQCKGSRTAKAGPGYKGVDLGDLGHSQVVAHTEENSRS